MEYVRLGSSGLKVSRLCLGCMSFGSGFDWMLPEEPSFAIVRKALDLGINFFDTADVYSLGESEQILGRALKHFGVRRDEVVVATKVFHPMGPGPNQRGLSRKHIFQAIDDSLQRLGMEYVDLYQIHRFDLETPIEETLDALTQLVRDGKVRYLGASSMAAYQFAKLLFRADQLRLAALRQHAEQLQPAVPRGRARDDSAVPRGRYRTHPLQPHRRRPARRQPPQRLGPLTLADGSRPLQPQGGRGGDRRRGLRRPAARRRRRRKSPSRGCCSSRVSLRSSALPGRGIWTIRSRPWVPGSPPRR